MPSLGLEWRDGPFGNTDASRTDALATYIEIRGVVPSVRTPSNQIRHRFVVGRKGTGKTHYLRALRQALDESKSIIHRQVDALRTEDVVRFTKDARRFYGKLAAGSSLYVDPYFYIREFWQQAWDRAILCSVASIVWEHRNSLRHIESDNWTRLKAHLPESTVVRSPADALSAIMHRHRRFIRARRFLADPEWTFVKRFLADAVKKLPPVVIIVDAIDDDFEAAPEPWLYCQDGLFKAIVAQLNMADVFSNRVHILAAIRDVVYSSLFRSEHALRYIQDSHLFHIRWDYRTTRYFLVQKLRSVIPEGAEKDESDLIRDWLGASAIQNHKRGISEPVMQYLLRHTRMVPRDVVLLGNALCCELGPSPKDKDVARVVHLVAEVIAAESIQTAINEALMSHEYVGEILRDIQEAISRGEGLQALSASDMRQMDSDIRASLSSQVDKFFRLLGKESFGYNTLVEALVKSGLAHEPEIDELCDRPYRFENILWRQGLIAYKDSFTEAGNWRFYNSSSFEGFLLPAEAPLYGLHTILLDKYPFLKTVPGGEPIF